MKIKLTTPHGDIRIGTLLHIDSVDAKTSMFKDGIDKQALEMQGKTGLVTSIDDKGSISGTWGGLRLIPEADRFTVIRY